MNLQDIINSVRSEARKLRSTITNGAHPETLKQHFDTIESHLQEMEHPGPAIVGITLERAVEILNERQYENCEWERSTGGVVGTRLSAGVFDELSVFAAIAVAEKLERENEPIPETAIPVEKPVVVEPVPVTEKLSGES